jgi:hypothetical protein
MKIHWKFHENMLKISWKYIENVIKVHWKCHENPSSVRRIIFCERSEGRRDLALLTTACLSCFVPANKLHGWGPIYIGGSSNPITQRPLHIPESTDSPNASATTTPNTAQPWHLDHRIGSNDVLLQHLSASFNYEGNSISKLQIQVATYVFELSAGNCHR